MKNFKEILHEHPEFLMYAIAILVEIGAISINTSQFAEMKKLQTQLVVDGILIASSGAFWGILRDRGIL